ncbi:MAG: hydantoinase/carbamoylase family amidase [Bdellovibrionota bacterium]
MAHFLIPPNAIRRHYETLHLIGNLGPSPADGFFRPAYSDLETAAMKYIESDARAAGLDTRWDALGNLTIETERGAKAYAESGSHLDTVPAGGNYDGVAGILAGLEALKYLKPSSSKDKAFRLRIWRGEESAVYGTAYLGSSSAFGSLNPKLLDVVFENETLESAMRKQDCDPELVRQGKRTIDQEEVDSILAHIELHIEQGQVLELSDTPIGIVTSIRGPQRYRVTLRGEFNHSGTTPMGVEFRKDVNLALGYMIVRLDELALKHRNAGADLVQTIGVVNSDASINDSDPELYLNAVSKISGFGYFFFEARSADATFKADYCAAAEEVIKNTARDFGVAADVVLVSKSAGIAQLDLSLQNTIAKAAERLGFAASRLASGAGHDAAIVAAQKQSSGKNVPAGMIFIPCLNGISHNPAELATPEAIASGASVLAQALSLVGSE